MLKRDLRNWRRLPKLELKRLFGLAVPNFIVSGGRRIPAKYQGMEQTHHEFH
jgi:hypothetical protein